MNQFVIGLSGHIDHGKTSIIHSLTGQYTDNLKEEIDRGMTINIGFAFMNNEITLIDVPGHEKFIKNMVVGVSSIDYALLIIAADDGIMPQTIEHFEILKLLDIKFGSIIINKIDLVDNEWLEMIELDIKDFVQDSFLSNTPIHRVSTLKNQGIEELKTYLLNVKDSLKNKNKYDKGIFSLYVDRIFNSKGFGQVVTGTIASGNIKTGDKLRLLPTNKEVKIRGIQTHNKNTTKLSIGDRAALNIHSNDKLNITRGSHLSTLGYFENVETSIVKLHILPKFKRGVKNNDRLRIYIGTQEVMARVFFPSDKKILTGRNVYAMLKFEKMIIAPFYDNFILRMYSPLITIGGGKIIDTNISGKWKENCDYLLKIEQTNNIDEIVELIIANRKEFPFSYNSLSKHLNLSIDKLSEILSRIATIQIINDKWIIVDAQLKNIKKRLVDFLESFHNDNPFRIGVLKKEIINNISIDDNLLDYIFSILLRDKIIKEDKDLWSLKKFKISLSTKDLEVYNKLVEIIQVNKFQTLSLFELKDYLNCNEKMMKQIISIGINNNDLILINGELLFARINIEDLKSKIYNHFSNKDTLDISEFKSLTNTTRKYAVPLLEYLDKLNITYRKNNERKLKK